MTTTNTNDQILDDSAVSEIEARFEIAARAFQPYKEVSDSLCDIPALCATVKHLREVNQGIIDGIADGKKLLHDQISNLQSQLEQAKTKFTDNGS